MSTRASPKILILENQLIIAADISRQFSKLGYNVIGFHARAEDALSTIKTKRPDIVIMNIGMRKKTNGLKTAKTITENYNIPIVFLSAICNKALFTKVLEAHPYAFIAKPYEKKDLKRGIETALDRMMMEGLWIG